MLFLWLVTLLTEGGNGGVALWRDIDDVAELGVSFGVNFELVTADGALVLINRAPPSLHRSTVQSMDLQDGWLQNCNEIHTKLM